MTIKLRRCAVPRQSAARGVALPDRRNAAARALAGALCLSALGLVFAPQCARAADLAEQPIRANFKHESASADAVQVADWVLNSGNHRNLSFVIIDKKNAKVFVFHPDGQLRGAAAVLLGEAIGDDSVPGIGERALSTILPQERTTPAGRFVAAIDRNLHGKDILWVDYGAAISLHRVVTGNPKERRAERLATPSSLDNRISYGCINVPVAFFNNVVTPAFKNTNGIVYILPETRPLQHVFADLSAAEQARLQR
ncbi:hypothetical protein [Massilia pseudoviolaceinigra]|uniref:hypothetical protein n=1 Tax=Massilia pseudoviolaceinigra TaxID=3057165 RepID=UPI002796AD8F|nr:hypothetical protein [Massilia sp. CCM 9206]MDQ1923022.1 hypothetical protein [Massilia sp. CCM 9206]